MATTLHFVNKVCLAYFLVTNQIRNRIKIACSQRMENTSSRRSKRRRRSREPQNRVAAIPAVLKYALGVAQRGCTQRLLPPSDCLTNCLLSGILEPGTFAN